MCLLLSLGKLSRQQYPRILGTTARLVTESWNAIGANAGEFGIWLTCNTFTTSEKTISNRPNEHHFATYEQRVFGKGF